MKWITFLFSYISFLASLITLTLLHTRSKEREKVERRAWIDTHLQAEHYPHPHRQSLLTSSLPKLLNSFSFSFPLFLLNLRSPKARFVQIRLTSVKTEVLSCRSVELCHQPGIFCDWSSLSLSLITNPLPQDLKPHLKSPHVSHNISPKNKGLFGNIILIRLFKCCGNTCR